MNSFNKFDISWEENEQGINGIFKYPKLPVTTYGVLQKIIFSKMLDVTLISADFDDELIVFEPRLLVKVESDFQVDFWGLYLSQDENEDEETIKNTPSICIRKITWDKKNELKRFRKSTNKVDYIMSNQQVLSKVIFSSFLEMPNLKKLISDLEQILTNGLSLTKNHTGTHKFSDIELIYELVELKVKVAYFPFLKTSQPLEAWLEKWRKFMDDSCVISNHVPDKSFQFSYNFSLLDRLREIDSLYAVENS